MKIEIKIVGQVKPQDIKTVRGKVDKMLEEDFESFKFSWELSKEA